MYSVFVDGQEGTTGLEICERLVRHGGVEVLTIDPSRRKDPKARQELLNAADVAFLCLPDGAARESASLVSNKSTVIIDASTAHRVDPHWVYGLPELNKNQRPKISGGKRISVPGCHATGFILAMYPQPQRYIRVDREDQILLVSRLDNLGKGASGAAVQNMNIALRLAESTGLG